MAHSETMRLSDTLKHAAPLRMQILTGAELDAVSGGDDMNATIGDGSTEHHSATTSQCHIDGNNEPGTS